MKFNTIILVVLAIIMIFGTSSFITADNSKIELAYTDWSVSNDVIEFTTQVNINGNLSAVYPDINNSLASVSFKANSPVSLSINKSQLSLSNKSQVIGYKFIGEQLQFKYVFFYFYYFSNYSLVYQSKPFTTTTPTSTSSITQLPSTTNVSSIISDLNGSLNNNGTIILSTAVNSILTTSLNFPILSLFALPLIFVIRKVHLRKK